MFCRNGKFDVVSYLLQQGCDPNCTNNAGHTPLSHTNNPETIRCLLHHGADPTREYTHLSKAIESDHTRPPESVVKVFVVGEVGAGKSTLTCSLQSTSGTKGVRLLKQFTKVSGVVLNTAGIHPHKLESQQFGSVLLYDFAGHKEFYASHDSLLSNTVVGLSSAVFLMVADLSKGDTEFEKEVQYWLQFLESKCSAVSTKPHLIIVGSHADQVKSEEKAKKAKIAKSLQSVSSSLHFAGFVAINCQYAISAAMSELCSLLTSSCKALRPKALISSLSHSLLVYILDSFPNIPAVQMKVVHRAIQKEASSRQELTETCLLSYVPLEQLFEACKHLNERGNILLLENSAMPHESLIIVDQSALLSHVNGTMFAPEGFKQHQQLATTTGIVPFSRIASCFPKLDTAMTMLFLSQLEFCHKVTDNEILQQFDDPRISQCPNESFFFFPGLVRIKVPSTVWQNQDGHSYHSGWMLQCTQPEQFFTPHFLQVLLLRIAFSDDLTPPREEVCSTHPAIQRKGNIWKDGICWSNQSGVEALLEITDINVTLLMRCLVNVEACVRLRSAIITKIRKAVNEFCPTVKTSEFILPSSATMQYPVTPVSVDQCAIPLSEIARAVSNNKPYVRDGKNRHTDIDTLLHFEPYAHLSQAILVDLLYRTEPQRNERVSDLFFDQLVYAYGHNQSKLYRALKMSVSVVQASVHPSNNLICALKLWRDETEGSYHCLRTTLDGLSIFAGRNPLVCPLLVVVNRMLQPGNVVFQCGKALTC